MDVCQEGEAAYMMELWKSQILTDKTFLQFFFVVF